MSYEPKSLLYPTIPPSHYNADPRFRGDDRIKAVSRKACSILRIHYSTILLFYYLTIPLQSDKRERPARNAPSFIAFPLSFFPSLRTPYATDSVTSFSWESRPRNTY